MKFKIGDKVILNENVRVGHKANAVYSKGMIGTIVEAKPQIAIKTGEETYTFRPMFCGPDAHDLTEEQISKSKLT